MKKTCTKLILFSVLCFQSTSSFSSSFGTFPRLSKIEENHIIKELSVSQIENFIITSSWDRHRCNDHYHGDKSQVDDPNSENLLSPYELASHIKKVSDTMKIDSGLFTSLIYKESQFCNFGGTIRQRGLLPTNVSRASETRAQGLTMFTNIAQKEINDQLFSHDKSTFHFKLRPILHRALYHLGFADIYPRAYEDETYYTDKKYVIDEKYQSNPKIKNNLKNPANWKEQILYGAILLKINLSSRSQSRVYSLSNRVAHYKRAIRKYNGADARQQYNYWNFIMELYGDVFNQDFKAMATREGIQYESRRWKTIKSQIELESR